MYQLTHFPFNEVKFWPLYLLFVLVLDVVIAGKWFNNPYIVISVIICHLLAFFHRNYFQRLNP